MAVTLSTPSSSYTYSVFSGTGASSPESATGSAVSSCVSAGACSSETSCCSSTTVSSSCGVSSTTGVSSSAETGFSTVASSVTSFVFSGRRPFSSASSAFSVDAGVISEYAVAKAVIPTRILLPILPFPVRILSRMLSVKLFFFMLLTAFPN